MYINMANTLYLYKLIKNKNIIHQTLIFIALTVNIYVPTLFIIVILNFLNYKYCFNLLFLILIMTY